MSTLKPVLACLLILLAASRAGAERAGPARPEQGGGMVRLPWQSWIDPALPFPRAAPQRRDRIVYAFDKPANAAVKVDPVLSRLCRSGQFMQLINLHYRAFGPKERPLGVAYGLMSVNLYDPTHRRQEDTVYFFKDQETTRCAVFTAKQADLRSFYIGP